MLTLHGGVEVIEKTRVVILVAHLDQEAFYKKVITEMRLQKLQHAENLEVHTVDAAQGGEWDVGIIDLTLDDHAGILGHKHRLSVLWTRLRDGCIVVGSFGEIGDLKRGNVKWLRALKALYRDESVRTARLLHTMAISSDEHRKSVYFQPSC